MLPPRKRLFRCPQGCPSSRDVSDPLLLSPVPLVTRKYDAIIVGGGHNGLICAAYLARAGRSVLVLERRHLVGGAAVTEEVYPGFKFSVCSYVVSLLRPEIISDLDLPKFGLELLPLNGTLTPMAEGDYLMRWHDAAETHRGLHRHSPLDADAYGEFGRTLYHMAKAVRPMMSTIPPDATSASPLNLARHARVGRSFMREGAGQLNELAKLMTMSSADYVDRWFETEALKGTLASSGIIGTFLGPRSPGSAYVMLHHYMGELDGQFRAWGLPRGGMGSVSEAIASSARGFGAEIRTEVSVDRVLVRSGRAVGVVLENGDELQAGCVVSSLDPRRTFGSLVGPDHLDEDFLEQVARYKIRGSSAKVNLALDGLPEFTCLERLRGPGHIPRLEYLRGAISVSPSVDYLERAYDDAKYGRYSRRPYMDVVIPTLADPSMAPPGKHVMSCFVQYAPYDLREGHWDDCRDGLGDAVLDTLAELAPNIRELVLHRQVVTPLDLERTFGLTEGNIFHGELTLEQLFFLRPLAGWADYRTPVAGLYMCGSGTHPGGGVMGAPGKLAAEVVLGDVS